MEHQWTRKGQVLLAIGFLISPDRGRYIGYKLIPEYGNKSMRKKPRVELCNGLLHRVYSNEDNLIILRTRRPLTSEYPTNQEAATAMKGLFNKKLLDGWIICKPAYPSTLLGLPWKHIRQVKLL